MAREIIDRPAGPGQRLTMTYEEYLDWADEETRSEWVDGEVFVFMAPKTPHARAVFFLARLIADFSDEFGLGEVLVTPVEMLIRDGRSSREPDIVFVTREHLHRVTTDRIQGAGDLVIEFISDDSVTRDRVEKFQEYAAEGIPEYWIFDSRPGKELSDFFRLGPDGDYHRVPIDADGRYHSAVVRGFWFKPEWLWQDPLPRPAPLVASILRDAGAFDLENGAAER